MVFTSGSPQLCDRSHFMRNQAVLVFGPDHNFGVIKDWIVTETFHKLENMESFFIEVQLYLIQLIKQAFRL